MEHRHGVIRDAHREAALRRGQPHGPAAEHSAQGRAAAVRRVRERGVRAAAAGAAASESDAEGGVWGVL